MRVIKKIISIYRSIFWKIGTKVTFTREQTRQHDKEKDGCPLCYVPTEEEIYSGEFVMFTKDDLCLKHYDEIE
jgi:uncharacterized protein Veg